VFVSTALIGLYGSVKYTHSSTKEFVEHALLFDQPDIVAALAIVGLFAAVLSTSNAQIFALGSEFRSLLTGDEKSNFKMTKVALFFFALIVLVFSVLMGDELVLLARMSFTGTSMITPIIIIGVISKRKPGIELIIVSGMALVIFLLTLFEIIPTKLADMRIDLTLHSLLFITAIVSILIRKTCAEAHQK